MGNKRNKKRHVPILTSRRGRYLRSLRSTVSNIDTEMESVNITPTNTSPTNISPGNMSPGNLSPANISPVNVSSSSASTVINSQSSSSQSEPERSSDSDYIFSGSDHTLDGSIPTISEGSASQLSPNNFIINIQSFFDFLLPNMCCKKCKSNQMILYESDKKCGLAATFYLKCESCKRFDIYNTSRSLSNDSNIQDLNLRYIYAMRAIGKGENAARMFSATMDLPQPVTHIERYYPKLLTVLEDVAEESMDEAAREVKIIEKGPEISASFDGSWQKRGYQSNNGIFTAISVKTKKILDFDCLSRYCNICNHGTDVHVCRINHEGSSGSMESKSAIKLFQRSIEKRSLQYKYYLGDGDSSAFQTIIREKPYGNDYTVYKLECVNHVSKRVVARLKKLKNDYKNKKVNNIRSIGGRGRLTDSVIYKLKSYYRNAIVNNTDNISEMKKAIMAILYHSISTDQNPQHEYCPTGPDTWCKYNKCLTQRKKNAFKHKPLIPEEIGNIIKPIFEDLSKDDLLKKCAHGGTQNQNEAFNKTVWERAPKTIYSGLYCFKICANDAVICFNDGMRGRLKILEKLGMNLSEYSFQQLLKFDGLREKAKKRLEFRQRNQPKKSDKASNNDNEYGFGKH